MHANLTARYRRMMHTIEKKQTTYRVLNIISKYNLYSKKIKLFIQTIHAIIFFFYVCTPIQFILPLKNA